MWFKEGERRERSRTEGVEERGLDYESVCRKDNM